MRQEFRFRMLLPAVQTVLATLFGGVGLWQRNEILNRPFLGDQRLWESTARFHVWPWPYKFAVISNMPAFLAGSLVSLPIRVLLPVNALSPGLPEAVELAISLVFVAMLWYWVGDRFDRRWPAAGDAGVFSGSRTPWILLLIFTAVCLVGALLPIGHVGYVPCGALLWLTTVFIIRGRH